MTIGPGLCPTSYRDSIIVYLDSTRRRYVSRVEYSTRMKPLSYSDTTYSRPRAVARSFAAFVDHRADTNRKWYKSSVRLEPKVYSSTQEYRVSGSAADRKSEVSSIADASMESLDYLSDGVTGSWSSPEVPSPLRIDDDSDGRRSMLDNWSEGSTTTVLSTSGRVIRSSSFVSPTSYTRHNRETNRNSNGHDGLFGRDANANETEIVTHRSGPFIYNAPKRRGGKRWGENEEDGEEYKSPQVNGDLRCNGVNHLNGYHTYDDDQHPLTDDLVDL